MKKKKTSLGLDEKVEGLLCYVLFWVTGVIFYMLETKSKFVKFHTMQSIITFFTLFAILLAVSWIEGMVGVALNIILDVFKFLILFVMLILWIVGMVKAYKGEKYKFPVFGDLAEKYAD